MDESASGRAKELLRSTLPPGTVTRVQVLHYGDDPSVEPGASALRVYLDRAGRPLGVAEDKEIMAAFTFAQASPDAHRKLTEGLPGFGWIEFRPEGVSEDAGGRIPITRFTARAEQAATAAGEMVAEQLTPVMTRLGSDDLATVDLLVTAGIASSRADALRWALGRIRQHPIYEQLQQRVQELSDLKSQIGYGWAQDQESSG